MYEGNDVTEKVQQGVVNYVTDKSVDAGKSILKYLSTPIASRYTKTLMFTDLSVSVYNNKRILYNNCGNDILSIIWFNVLFKKYNDNPKRMFKKTDLGSWCAEIPDNGIYYKKMDNTTIALITFMDKYEPEDGDYVTFAKLQFIGKNAQLFYLKTHKAVSKIYQDSRVMIESSKTGTVIFADRQYQKTVYDVKNINDIIMNLKKKSDILKIIDDFIKNKDLYEYHNIPYRIGALSYGPPGTGKSSLAYSIAKYINCPLIIVSPEYIYDKVMENETIATASKYRIVLIEEIDTMMKEYNMSLSSSEKNQSGVLRRDHILKFIDNLPDGTILMANTNHYEKLDSAVIRSGRFDIKIEMDNFTKDEAIQMIKSYNLEEAFIDKYTDRLPICPSELQFDIMKEISRRIINSKEDL